MKKLTILVLVTLAALAAVSFAQDDGEEAAVREAVLDYVEGIYEVDPSRIERSVHPQLAKRGYGRRSADWGIDYMHLAKYDGKWKIVNVLWQSHPPE